MKFMINFTKIYVVTVRPAMTHSNVLRMFCQGYIRLAFIREN